MPAFAENLKQAAAQSALSRYLLNLDKTGAAASGKTTRVEIQAAIPKLAKQGYFRGIRHANAIGAPEYQVLAVTGDSTVKQQVIARYLVAEAQAAGEDPSAIAISSANYRFRYAGSIATGGKLLYVFDIKPKQKRTGLIEGQLWIDAATGAAVHQSGRFVKKPSVFVRSVEITRDSEIRDDMLVSRVTHVEIDTRIAGRATLLVSEKPLDSNASTLIANRAMASESGQ